MLGADGSMCQVRLHGGGAVVVKYSNPQVLTPTSQCVISRPVNHAQLSTEHEANASYSGADGED